MYTVATKSARPIETLKLPEYIVEITMMRKYQWLSAGIGREIRFNTLWESDLMQ